MCACLWMDAVCAASLGVCCTPTVLLCAAVSLVIVIIIIIIIAMHLHLPLACLFSCQQHMSLWSNLVWGVCQLTAACALSLPPGGGDFVRLYSLTERASVLCTILLEECCSGLQSGL